MSTATNKTNDDQLDANAILLVIAERLNAAMFELLNGCIEQTRRQGVTPTVRNAACLGMQVDPVLNIHHEGFQAFLWDQRLESARVASEIEVEPAEPHDRPNFRQGRDLSIWFVPGDDVVVGRTTDQAAYLLQVAALSRLERIADRTLEEFEWHYGLGDEITVVVRRAVSEHCDWWLAPTYTRHNVDGWVRCQSCDVELSQLNVAEAGSVVEECRMCRGWFTQEQQHEKHRQRQREALRRVARR